MSDNYPRVNKDMGATPDDKFNIYVVTDGTSTYAEISQEGTFGREPIGIGVARRRKGDKRREDVGMRLAVGRAMKVAVERIENALNKKGYTL